MLWDHPRSRGEYRGRPKTPRRWAGSSPLSRGILEHVFRSAFLGRIIPALAGNTAVDHDRRDRIPDHPRSRGEYSCLTVRQATGNGSSPLSRGIRHKVRGRSPRPGIIPALAGNTDGVAWRWPGGWDHPRSRGEYAVVLAVLFMVEGSSPLSRGIPRRRWWFSSSRRIIPALAGNTVAATAAARASADHPRSRGEYGGGRLIESSKDGSSPLSRGIRVTHWWHSRWWGIIPALAGNTVTPHKAQVTMRDHPRSRGEYSLMLRRS